MNKKVIFVIRQMLIGLIALQFLNLSVGSSACWEDDYDYSYSYNKTYDPTETAVEWIVEMNYGQQTGFTYDNHADTNKSISKTFHWKTDLPATILPTGYRPVIRSYPGEAPAPKTPSPFTGLTSPPPERVV